MAIEWEDIYKGEWSDDERTDLMIRLENKIWPAFSKLIDQLPINAIAANIYEKVQENTDLRIDFEVHPPHEGKTTVTIVVFPWICVHHPESIVDADKHIGKPWLIGRAII